MHIIEARNLKAEDLAGTSDPVCYVKVWRHTYLAAAVAACACAGVSERAACVCCQVGSQKKNTAVHKKTMNVVFDEVLFFNLPNMTRGELERQSIEVCAV